MEDSLEKAAKRAARREYLKTWRAANSEKQKAYDKASRDKNRDKRLLQTRAWQLANPEKVRANAKASYNRNRLARIAKSKAYNDTHPESRKATNKAWRIANLKRTKATRKAWLAANPESRAEYERSFCVRKWAAKLITNARGSSKKRGHSPPTITETWVLEQYDLQSGRCYWTGVPLIPSSVASAPDQPSLDRLDNTAPYTPVNCVLASWFINRARGTLSVADFKFTLDAVRDGLNAATLREIAD